MCCFAGPSPVIVQSTRIFARTAADRGTLVYSMKMSADDEVAMILPLPVRLGAAGSDKLLSFVDLSGYEDFFDDLERGFPVERPAAIVPPFGAVAVAAGPPPLPVEKVGSFEASFVPTLADFERLDPRFQLAPAVWDRLPAYADYGFAVFRLKPGSDRIHPMAFRFRTRFPDRVFFPTVHVHDGAVHATADFDHQLYYQLASERPAHVGEEKSPKTTADFVSEAQAKALVRMNGHLYRQTLLGERPNRDTFVQ